MAREFTKEKTEEIFANLNTNVSCGSEGVFARVYYHLLFCLIRLWSFEIIPTLRAIP